MQEHPQATTAFLFSPRVLLRRVYHHLNCGVYLVKLAESFKKRLSPHSNAERKKNMTHLDQNPDPPVEGSEYWDHMRVHRTDPVKRVKASVLPDTLVNVLVLRRMWAERKKHK